jgi:hypothetical protein
VIAGLTQVWQNRAFARLAMPLADLELAPDSTIRQKLTDQLRRTFPEAAYTAFSGQITIFLASLFGATQSVASLGALGRIGIIVTLVGATFSSVATPRFARLQLPRARILAWFFKMQAALLVCAVGFVVAIVAGRSLLLAILGPNYANLELEVALMACASALALLAQQTYSLASVRRLVPPQLIVIPVNLAVQIGLILILRVDTLDGLLWLSIGMFAAQWLVNLTSFVWLNARAETGFGAPAQAS